MSAFSQTHGMFNMFDDTINIPFDNDDQRVLPPQEMINPPSKAGSKNPLPNGILPFAIHSSINSDPYMWAFEDCKKAAKLRDQTLKSLSDKIQASETFMNVYNDVLKKYEEDDDFMKGKLLATKAFTVGDFFIMDMNNSNDPQIPSTYDNAWMLSRWYDLTIYGTYGEVDVARAAVTPILNQIKTYFEKATAEKPSPLKYVMYSGHDDTIAAHLRAIGYASHDCVLNAIITGKQEDFTTCPSHPRTSSNIIWELIDDRDGINKSWLVKVSYNGEYLDYCKNKKKDADGYSFCTLDEFYQITQT